VRLGKSGLKISRIVLGCMTYGSPEWAGWVLGEEDGIAHIKAAYDAGINAFDTANVRSRSFLRRVGGTDRHSCRCTRTACQRLSSAKRLSSTTCRGTKSWS
jgi:predicted aldo/keto reductase-like oxidoreductase